MNTDEEKALYNQLREAVHYQWDPIGVSSYSESMGEYDSYVPRLYKILKEGANPDQIFDYLWIVETDSIGLSGNRQSTMNFANWLYNLFKNQKFQSN